MKMRQNRLLVLAALLASSCLFTVAMAADEPLLMKQQSEEPSGDAGWPINTNLNLMGPLLFALHDSASDRGPLYQKRTLNKNFIRFGKSEMKEKIMKRILEEVENGHRTRR